MNSILPLPTSELTERRKHFKVLCAVDEQPGPQQVAELLREDGFSVESCRTPEQGLSMVADDPEIGIVVCDIQCGDLRGHQFFSRVLDHVPPERPLSVIFLAEAASINDVVAAMRLQAVDFLRKPVHLPTLLEAVRRADRLLHRRVTEKLMLRRATDLVEVMRAMVDWLPGGPAGFDQAAGREIALIDAETEQAVALDRTKKELRRVKSALRAQKIQRKLFGSELVANPCWDMLLDLYEKTLLQKSVCVSSLALASGVPVTTALRRMAKLEELGFVRRGKDQADGRRVFVELTDNGLESLGQYLEQTE